MSEEFDASKYEDLALLSILDALVADLGTVAAHRKLGVNYRTLAKCRDSRQMRPLMRTVLKQCVGWGTSGDNPAVEDPLGSAGQADGGTEGSEKSPALKVAELEAENSRLGDTNETQRAHIADWGRRLVSPGTRRHQGGVVGLLLGRRHISEERLFTDRFMDPPTAGIVTLEHRLGEEQVLGPAASLVSEWRDVGWRLITSEDNVERAQARVRGLQLEIELIEAFDLTLPPHTEPWDTEGQHKASSERRDDMVRAREDLEKAKKKQSRGRS